MHERATTRSWWHACGLGFMAAEERGEQRSGEGGEKGKRERKAAEESDI